MIADTFNWSCKHTWKRSAKNTAWCVFGCAIGDFGTILYFQLTEIPFSYFRDNDFSNNKWFNYKYYFRNYNFDDTKINFVNALKTALGMSLISMISMEIMMNFTDYILTGGAILTWWVIPIMLIVGFLTPWPYNYWRLKKYGINCH